MAGALLLLAATAPDVRAACDPTICVGGATSCTISGTNIVDNGCTLNWSTKDVTLAGTASLETANDGDYFTVLTDDFDVLGTIKARGSLGIDITAGGFFKTRVVSSSPGKIDVSNGGDVTIVATGAVDINGNTTTADGITSGTIDAGCISITGSSVSTTKAITANGGGGGGYGGCIDIISTTGSISIGGDVSADGAGSGADGGAITLDSATTLTVTKKLQANGASDGWGGSIDMTAIGASSIQDTVKVNGGANGGPGGAIALSAASATVTQNWATMGGTGEDGGTIDITTSNGAIDIQSGATFNGDGGAGGSGDAITLDATGGAITVSAPMSSSGSGGWDGGTITFSSDRNVTLAANISATGTGSISYGGEIDATAGSNHTLSVTKILDARSTTSNGGRDGDIELDACTVSVTGGSLKNRNTALTLGLNKVSYQNTYTLNASGSMTADDPATTSCATPGNGNVIYCRCVDANSDTVCDTPAACVTAPTLSGTVTPTALVCPVYMPACG